MQQINGGAELTSKLVEKGDFNKAFIYCQKTMTLLNLLSEGIDVYNVLKYVAFEEDLKLPKIMNGDVKTTLNLSTTWTNFNSKVYSSLTKDFMKPVTDLGKATKATF